MPVNLMIAKGCISLAVVSSAFTEFYDSTPSPGQSWYDIDIHVFLVPTVCIELKACHVFSPSLASMDSSARCSSQVVLDYFLFPQVLALFI